MRTTRQIRNEMVLHAEWAIEHRDSIEFKEIRPMPINSAVHQLPLTMDCSTFVTVMAKWAGAPDPNGLGYNGTGFTGTLLSHLPHIDRHEAKRGDLVVYGDAPGKHVVMLLQDVASHPNPLIASEGQEADPRSFLLSDESMGFTGLPMTFLRTIYDCHRQEATGNASLQEIANRRRTSVAKIVEVTEKSHKFGRGFYGINDDHLAKFKEYVKGGTDQTMPEGLVFYTINR